jgi:regulatory protein
MLAKRSKRPRPLDEDAAREQCLRLLTRRARAAAELRQRLRTAGYEQNIIDTVLAGLEQAGLVDDAEFARMWVAERTAAGTGRHRLQWELRRKGIREDLIRQAVEETVDEGRELEQALELARRRLRGEPAEGPACLRLRRFLVGRGYGSGTVEQVMRRLTSQEDLSDAL